MDELQKAGLVKAVGQAIALRRAAAGLSQERVAEALGITREAVSRMETGVAVPSVVRLAELAEIFSCGIEELLTDVSSRRIDQARTMVDLFDGLADDKRQLLVSIIRQIAQGFGER
ncbi:helix-turn-helix domain-containing protein [Paraburkholderia haematera]|nr:helix-turn-helix transcriptional regulator [Paraburkholderia haematera]